MNDDNILRYLIEPVITVPTIRGLALPRGRAGDSVGACTPLWHSIRPRIHKRGYVALRFLVAALVTARGLALRFGIPLARVFTNAVRWGVLLPTATKVSLRR